MARAGLLVLLSAALGQGSLGELPALDAEAGPGEEGKDDVEPDGACKDLISRHCSTETVSAGNGQVAHCLYEYFLAAESRHQEDGIPMQCKREVGLFLFRAMKHEPKEADPRLPGTPGKNRSKPFWVEPVPGLHTACEQDIERLCAGLKGQRLTRCLKARKAELSGPCSRKVFKVQEMQARDMTLDPAAYEACKADLESVGHCAHWPPPARKSCLVKNRDSLSEGCKEALFKKEAEESEDVRLNRDLLKACQEAISAECKDVPFGEARVLECLWDKVVATDHESGAYDVCQTKVKELVGRQVADYRLDFRVRSKCQEDIGQHCSAEKELVDRLPISKLFGSEGEGGQVLRCLKKNFDGLQPECHREMARVARIQSSHADLDPEIQRRCKSELNHFCSGLEPGEIHTCLRRHLKDLSQECRETELLHNKLVKGKGGLGVSPKVFQLCKQAADDLCPGMQWREQLKCMQDHSKLESTAPSCKEALTAELEANNHDWQLKHGITSQCQEDVEAQCRHHKREPGTAVLDCLSKLYTSGDIAREGCKEEVGRYLKGGAENIEVFPKAYEACQGDVAQFCRKVQPGQGRVHACLLRNKEDLSQACAAVEFQNQEAVAGEIVMSLQATHACKPVMEKMCPGVEPGGGRMWACLFKQRSNPDMPRECAEVVMAHQKLKHNEFFLNPGLAKRCGEEAERLCPNELAKATQKDFTSHGAVISCLIKRRSEIDDPDCLKSVARKHSERVADASMDPDHEAVCRADIDTYCKEAEEAQRHSRGTKGLVHKCLQQHVEELSSDCAESEKAYMVAASKDTRLNPAVDQHCKQAKQRWCEGQPDGEGHVVVCLLVHMHFEEMEPPCREALEGEQKKRAISLSFNPLVKKMCSDELTRFTREKKCKSVSGPKREGTWIDCITDNVEDIKDTDCKGAVLKVMQVQSSDLRAVPRMHAACMEDLRELCPKTAPGAARWHTCLRQKVGSVQSGECRELVLKVWRADNNSASLNFKTRKNCANEVMGFCADVQSGESRVLKCLTLNMNEAGFGEKCRKAISRMNITKLHKAPKSFRTGEHSVVKELEELMNRFRIRDEMIEENVVLLMFGSVGFVAIVIAWIVWCIFGEKIMKCCCGKTGYAVVVPRDLEC